MPFLTTPRLVERLALRKQGAEMPALTGRMQGNRPGKDLPGRLIDPDLRALQQAGNQHQ